MRAFLFDLDDTLFDHRHSTRAALAAVQQRLPGLAALTLSALEARHHAILEELHLQVLRGAMSVDDARVERLRRLLRSQGADAAGPALAAAARDYREAYLAARRPLPGAVELLRALRGHGAIAVVSNNLAAEQAAKIDVCGLREWIDALVVSEDAGCAKPDPAIFHDALRRVRGRAERAVMVGDSWSADVLGARAAGIRAVWFNPHGQPCPEPDAVAVVSAWEPVAAAMRHILGDGPGEGTARDAAADRKSG